MQKYHYLIAIILLSLLIACSTKEPEGPAEQIGRGIDLIAKGLNDIDNPQKQRQAEGEDDEEQSRRYNKSATSERDEHNHYHYDNDDQYGTDDYNSGHSRY